MNWLYFQLSDIAWVMIMLQEHGITNKIQERKKKNWFWPFGEFLVYYIVIRDHINTPSWMELQLYPHKAFQNKWTIKMLANPVSREERLMKEDHTHFQFLYNNCSQKQIYQHCMDNLQFGMQVALASLECVQAATLLLTGQSTSLVSFPVQPTLL